MTDAREKLKEIAEGLDGVTPGPWQVYDGCSWRRIGTATSVGRGSRDDAVLCPTKSASDGHPDLTCGGGNDLHANLHHIARCDPDTIRSIADLVAAQDARIAELEAALRYIAALGGNMSDEAFLSRTGPNDAAHRGGLYASAREIARKALGGKDD